MATQSKLQFDQPFINDFMRSFPDEPKYILFAILKILLEADKTDITRIIALAQTYINNTLTGEELKAEVLRISNLISKYEYEGTKIVERNNDDGSLRMSEEFILWKEILLELLYTGNTATPLFRKTEWRSKNFLHKINLISNLSNEAERLTASNTKHTTPLNILQGVKYTINPDIRVLENKNFDPENKDHDYVNRLAKFTESLDDNTSFYFLHNYDRRGRMYSKSIANIHPQGDNFSKALLIYAESKPLGIAGLAALKISLASKLQDKNTKGAGSYKELLRWYGDKGEAIVNKAYLAGNDWEVLTELFDGDFTAYAVAMDLARASLIKSPETYESSLIIHQDATSSGFQIAAALTGDEDLAKLTNITTSSVEQVPNDLFKFRDELRNQLPGSEWTVQIDRKFCKKPLMTTGYGTGMKTIIENLNMYLTGTKFHGRVEEIQVPLESAREKTAGSLLTLTKGLREALSDNERIIFWETSDGFTAVYDPRDKSDRETRLGNPKKQGSKQPICYTEPLKPEASDPIDSDRFQSGISPNFIHSIDAALARTAICKAWESKIHITAIHDSFGTHAADVGKLNEILRKAFIKTMEYGWIGNFKESNDIPFIELPVKGDYDIQDAIYATYMFSLD